MKHYYCSVCHKTVVDSQNVCTNCQQYSSVKYFIRLSIIDQLKLIISKKNYLLLLQYRFDRLKISQLSIEDIYDGSIYSKGDLKEFLENPNNISLTWCTDGVPVFKSTKLSIWPFYMRINELPYNLRILRENTILAGLYIFANISFNYLIIFNLISKCIYYFI